MTTLITLAAIIVAVWLAFLFVDLLPKPKAENPPSWPIDRLLKALIVVAALVALGRLMGLVVIQ